MQDTYHNFTLAMREKGVPWSFTMGNHDIEANLRAEELYEMDSKYDLSMTKPNAKPNLSR